MARKAVPKKTGRPRAAIDWSEAAELCRMQCPGTEVAAYFGITTTTLYDRCQKDNGVDFSTFSADNKSKGKSELRRAQWSLAMEGDKTMQIWLGKQYLEQAETNKIEHSGTMKTEQHVVDYSKLSDAALEEIIKAGEQKPNE